MGNFFFGEQILEGMIIIHRGNQAFRQNSLMAVLTALDRAFMSVVEFDIYWLDGRWVLAHDSSKTGCADNLQAVIDIIAPRMDSSTRLLIDIKWDKPDQDIPTAFGQLATTLEGLNQSSFLLQFPSIEAFQAMPGNYKKGLLIPSPALVDWSLLPEDARFVMIDMSVFGFHHIDSIRKARPNVRIFAYTCKGMAQYLAYRHAVDAIVCDISW